MITNLRSIPSALWLVLIGILMTGCSSLATKMTVKGDPYGQKCAVLYQSLDRISLAAGTRDAGRTKIDGFPHLRVDRFLSTFAEQEMTDERLAAWLERLRRLDYAARLFEYANLPQDSREKLNMQTPDQQKFQQQLDQCGRWLNSMQLDDPNRLSVLFDNASVPDDYAQWRRVVGLYPIVKLFARSGVEDLHQELSKNFNAAPNQIPVDGQIERYSPKSTTRLTAQRVANLLAESSNNPLNIPEPSDETLAQLFDSFAPIWEVDTVNANDRIGAIAHDPTRGFYVDYTHPEVYQKLSYTRFDGKILLQLNFVVWFPSREKQSAFDPYGGQFDGLIWRVTLNDDGYPLAYDSIHPCGCYYLIFPRGGMTMISPNDTEEPVLSPHAAPELNDHQRLVIRIAHRTHFVDRIYTAPANSDGTVYSSKAYSDLRSVTSTNGERISLFDEQGMVRGSERLERFFLWPLGVTNPGAMRQWGRHAIAFIGKRHFDDPDLLEKLIKPIERSDTGLQPIAD